MERGDPAAGLEREHGACNSPHAALRRGSGLSTFYHGAGFTGGGEVALKSRLRVAGRPDGGGEGLGANIRGGPGTLAGVPEAGAPAAGLRPESVTLRQADTSPFPESR